ncbi:MAG: ribulose-phosphate 3-epimerase [Anaerolineaceae bacterium]|nr:ribulose-phosphate 3-epimerase [Anaerolineaceae bacterium]
MAKSDTIQGIRRDAPVLTAGLASADMMDLAGALKSVEDAGLKLLHFDVMDGRFCPLLTFGPGLVKAVRTDLFKDVHLMVLDPIDSLADYVQAGADLVVVNVESTTHIHRALQLLGQMENVNDPGRGILRGVALNPGTPLQVIAPLMDDLEIVTLLAVNPGCPGQSFIPAIEEKLGRLVAMIGESGRDILVGIDGGIRRDNIAEVASLGPDIIVAGSAVFKGDDPGGNAKSLIEAARRGRGAGR